MKREFDRKIWKSGNSYVITIPAESVERYKLEGKFVTVAISDEDDSLINSINKSNSNRKGKDKEKPKEKEVKNG